LQNTFHDAAGSHEDNGYIKDQKNIKMLLNSLHKNNARLELNNSRTKNNTRISQGSLTGAAPGLKESKWRRGVSSSQEKQNKQDEGLLDQPSTKFEIRHRPSVKRQFREFQAHGNTIDHAQDAAEPKNAKKIKHSIPTLLVQGEC